MTIKQDYNKILEGCGKGVLLNRNCGQRLEYSGLWLCPSCQAKKEIFLERCKDELEFLENELIFMDDIVGCDACIISKDRTNERISQLKEVLEMGK